MESCQHKFLRSSLFILLIIALILSGLFSSPITATGVAVEKTVTKYHLDIGAQQVWGSKNAGGTVIWDHGIGKGSTLSTGVTLDFPTAVSNVKAYVYAPSKFQWGTPGYTFNPNGYLNGESDYIQNYAKHCANAISNIRVGATGTKINLSYSATLTSGLDFDLKKHLNAGGLPMVLELMGGEATVKANQPEVYRQLVEGSKKGFGPEDYGYLYFTPIIIQYDVVETVEVGELHANLTIPSSAKQNESFRVSDSSTVSNGLNLEGAVLEKHYGDGNWKPVATWNGRGIKGENTGGCVEQREASLGEVTYRLTLTTDTGQRAEDVKTITITDSREVMGMAKLELPPFTYEGHKAAAVDASEFQMNGIHYSARRAYEEGLAQNGFSTVPSGSGKAVKTTRTTADVVFPLRGNYSVKLTAQTVSGQTLSDTKPIDVRKTPYILENLGGIQKQNRKQLLNISVAIYPDKPIVDYYIELKDINTGQTIQLTKARLQENNATIKTRPHKTSGDSYWTNFQLEFLTKTPSYNAGLPKESQGQEFRYTVYVKDSKGDTDTVQKTFRVLPDLPPEPQIVMQGTHLRNKGENVATLMMEDGTTTDGDQLQRVWETKPENPAQSAYTNVEHLQGYQDFSFGNKQRIGFHQMGVGKYKVRLTVKDRWNEPTLEEYITEADCLSAQTESGTEVINIAPEVTLKAVPSAEVNIGILAENDVKAFMEQSVNTLSAKLIEKGYDPNIQILSKARAHAGSMGSLGSWEQPVSVNCPICRHFGLKFDGEYVYQVVSSGQQVSGYQDVCMAPHTIQAVRAKDEKKGNAETIQWRYTVNESNDFNFQVDKQEKYVYLLCKDMGKTLVLNRNTGALVSTFPFVMDENIFYGASGNLFTVGAKGVQKIEGSTGRQSTLQNQGGALTRLEGGKATFIGKKDAQSFYIGKLNLNKEAFENIGLPTLPRQEWAEGPASEVTPTDMDNRGTLTFKQDVSDADQNRRGTFFWIVNTKTQKTVVKDRTNVASEMVASKVGLVKDEKGEGKYVYFAHVDKHGRIQSPKWSFYLELYDLAGTLLTSYAKETGVSNYEPIIYAALNTKENAIYLKEGASISTSDFGGNLYGRHIRIALPLDKDGAYVTDSFTPETMGFDLFDEIGSHSDGYYGTYMNYDRWTGMTARTKLLQKTMTEEETRSISIATRFSENPSVKNYVTDADRNVENLYNRVIENLDGTKEKVLRLTGNGDTHLASIEKSYTMEADTIYGYEYTMGTPTGAATDLFYSTQIQKRGENAGQGGLYGKVVAEKSFSSPGGEDFFTSWTSYYLRDRAGLGSGYYGKRAEREDFSCWVKFTMEEDGWVEFDYFRSNGNSAATESPYTIRIDNVVVKGEMIPGNTYNLPDEHEFFFLPKGAHEIALAGYNGTHGYIGLDNLKVGYLSKEDNGFQRATIRSDKQGGFTKVTNEFRSPKTALYEKQIPKEVPLEIAATGKLNFVATGYPVWTITGNSASIGSSQDTGAASGYLEVAAGLNEVILVTYEEATYGQMRGSPYNPATNTGEFLESSAKQTIIVRPGEKVQRHFSCYKGTYNGSRPDGWVSLSNIKTVVLPASSLPLSPKSKFFVADALCHGTIEEDLYEIKFDGVKCVITQYAAHKKEESQKMGLSLQGAGVLISAAEIKDFQLYKMEKGKKEWINTTLFNSEDGKTGQGWWNSTKGTGKVEIVEIAAEQPEDTPLIYKKGQLVAYNLSYRDYENDPSKRQYWKYVHTPFNDGDHPEADTILDGDGQIVRKASPSAILAKSIPRFYVDGKYTVNHWQEDNTNRTGDQSGHVKYKDYDKKSNVESVTFYIEGGASAPWVDFIRTVPGQVKEGQPFTLQIQVDDLEKDMVHLTTEVYRDKKLIYTHRQKNMTAPDVGGGLKGSYPLVETGSVTAALGGSDTKALAGKYEVVCTVRDQAGTGVKSYGFIILTEGKISGIVNHTDQWDKNRKKYNVKKFGEEVNRVIPFSEYIKLKEPRKRGTNVFWSGEKFQLEAKIGGVPQRVTAQIVGHSTYQSTLKNTNVKNATGETIYTGSIWDSSMINKWGRKGPQPLTFLFTATYPGGMVKTHEVEIIVDSRQDYWQLHRLW